MGPQGRGSTGRRGRGKAAWRRTSPAVGAVSALLVRDDVPQQPQDGGDRIVFDAVGTHGGGNRSRALLVGVLAVAAWLATAVAPAYALTSAGKMELLRTYQPVTWFSAAELFTPTNVGAFEGNVRLRW